MTRNPLDHYWARILRPWARRAALRRAIGADVPALIPAFIATYPAGYNEQTMHDLGAITQEMATEITHIPSGSLNY
jgi:hypothetical protein